MLFPATTQEGKKVTDFSEQSSRSVLSVVGAYWNPWETILQHRMIALIVGTSLHTTQSNAFLGKYMYMGFPSQNPKWNQNLQFLPLRDTVGFFIIVMCDSLPSPLPTGPLFRYWFFIILIGDWLIRSPLPYLPKLIQHCFSVFLFFSLSHL